jgi:hypothetical protein
MFLNKIKFEVVNRGDQYDYVALKCDVMGSKLYDEDLF